MVLVKLYLSLNQVDLIDVVKVLFAEEIVVHDPLHDGALVHVAHLVPEVS